jgi:hypothetical protein
MCTNDHDATCTAFLSRSDDQPEHLVASLRCETCDQVVKVIGVVEHTFAPLLGTAGAELVPALRATRFGVTLRLARWPIPT